jgi:signal transduction histidine kinase
LRGKRGGLAAFLVIAGLVAGGLGWVTQAALRLEREQAQFRAEANAWLALWRLDSRIFTDLANEANLPFQEFRLVPVTQEPNPGPGSALVLVEMIPTASGPELSWVQRRLLAVRRTDWKTPEALRTSWRQGLGRPTTKDATATGARPALRVQLAGEATLLQMLTRAAGQITQPAGAPAPDLPSRVAQQMEPQGAFPNSAPNQQPPSPQRGRDASLRQSRAQLEINQQAYQNQAIQNSPNPAPVNLQPILAVRGPLVPAWLGDGDDRRLVLTRLLQIGERPACQVTLLDWPQLRRLLAEEVRDLLPDPHLDPASADAALNPDRTMTALPVVLDPGPFDPGEAVGLNPLRIGLVLAWSAALVAVLAVGLGGWSLLNLSERRIRFVSAVTHELRTPLTTLRLYLDMLATGMVRDEAQKTDYIQTLNQEADRLNRLVGNVLDFSRLENQRPRLEKAPVAVAELLSQVEETWQGRCRNAAKELLIVNELPADAVLITDVQLVSQILGNLIDNACKYSQGIDDPRIWVRAKGGPRRHVVLEVEDRGRGVPPRDRRVIFRPFRRGRSDQAPSGGVGLGLALARQWAELLGGHLNLTSAAGKVGACFRLELPSGL